MHLIDRSVGFYGSVPIVAGTVPLAAGAALASKIRNQKNISVAFFGDGWDDLIGALLGSRHFNK